MTTLALAERKTHDPLPLQTQDPHAENVSAIETNIDTLRKIVSEALALIESHLLQLSLRHVRSECNKEYTNLSKNALLVSDTIKTLISRVSQSLLDANQKSSLTTTLQYMGSQCTRAKKHISPNPMSKEQSGYKLSTLQSTTKFQKLKQIFTEINTQIQNLSDLFTFYQSETQKHRAQTWMNLKWCLMSSHSSAFVFATLHIYELDEVFHESCLQSHFLSLESNERQRPTERLSANNHLGK